MRVPGTDLAETVDHDDGYKWRAFAAIAISFVTMVMSISMVFVALSAIAAEYGVTLRAVSWVVIVQALTITALMLPMGRLADIIGRRRVHLIGLGLFAGGSIGCALAPSLGTLLAARVVMAVGNSMGQSVGSAMVVSVFPPEERGRAIGSQASAVAVGAAAGPILAGLVLQAFSWRALFVIVTVPILVAFVAGYRILDEARVTPDNHNAEASFDHLGAVLSSLAVVAVVLTMSNPLALPWGSPVIVAGTVVGVALLGAFVWWELRTVSPMLDIHLFRNRVLATAIATRLIGFTAGTASQLLLPIFLISYRGMREGAAGAVMFLSAVGLGLASQVCGRLTDRLGERRFLVLGFGGSMAAAVGLGMIEDTTPLVLVTVVVFANGLAQGTWAVPNNSVVMGSVPRSMLGVAGALSNLTRNVGSVIGQAIAAAVVAAVMVSRGFDIALDEVRDTPGAGAAFLEGWQRAYVVVVVLALAGLVLTLLVRPDQFDDPGGTDRP